MREGDNVPNFPPDLRWAHGMVTDLSFLGSMFCEDWVNPEVWVDDRRLGLYWYSSNNVFAVTWSQDTCLSAAEIIKEYYAAH